MSSHAPVFGLLLGQALSGLNGFAARSIKRRLILVLGLVLVLQALVGASQLAGMLVSRSALDALYQERLLALQHMKAVNDGFALSAVEVAHKVRDGNMNATSGLAVLQSARPVIDRNWQALPSLPGRSEARRVGKEGVSTCRSWGSPEH